MYEGNEVRVGWLEWNWMFKVSLVGCVEDMVYILNFCI